MCAVWANLDHQSAAWGHKRVGLTNNLDGSEDHFVSRQAKVCWEQLGMSLIRDQEVASIKARVEDGSLSTWNRETLEGLVEPFPDGDVGVFIEGQEIEKHTDGSDDSDNPWGDDEGDDSGDDDDDNAALAIVKKTASAKDCVIVDPSDTSAEVEQLDIYIKEKASLDHMRKAAKDSNFKSLQFHIERDLETLARRHHLGNVDAGPSAIMSRFVRAKRKRGDEAIAAQREVNWKR